MIIHHERPLSVTTMAGSWVANTIKLRGLLKQVVVKPATSTTEYDFSLTNDKSNVIYNRTDTFGILNEEIDLPISGVYTMTISNSTSDEGFNVLLVVRET